MNPEQTLAFLNTVLIRTERQDHDEHRLVWHLADESLKSERQSARSVSLEAKLETSATTLELFLASEYPETGIRLEVLSPSDGSMAVIRGRDPSEEVPGDSEIEDFLFHDELKRLYDAARQVALREVSRPNPEPGVGVENSLAEMVGTGDNSELQDPEMLITAPVITRVPKRPQSTMLMARLIALAVERDTTPRRWINGWSVLERLGRGPNLDMVLLPAGKMLSLMDKNIEMIAGPMLKTSELKHSMDNFTHLREQLGKIGRSAEAEPEEVAI
jgi:hypothetical protein